MIDQAGLMTYRGQQMGPRSMTFSINHHLFTMHGTMPAGEIWSVGLRSSGAGAYTDAQLATATQNLCDRFRTFAQALSSTGSWSAGVSLAGCTGRAVDTLGKTLQIVEKAPTTSFTAGSNSIGLPNQCAIVMSLIGSIAGRRGKGRIYLPLLSAGSGLSSSTGKHSQASNIATNGKTMLDGMHTDLRAIISTGPAERIFVMSRVGAGSVSPVVSIKIGDVIDTQRRRRGAIAELYTVAVLA